MRMERATGLPWLLVNTAIVCASAGACPGFFGHVTGIDQSPFLIDAASRFAGDENLAGRIDFRVGDTRSLDLGAGEFDAAVGIRCSATFEEPIDVLRELARVVKPGSLVGIFDGDYASLTFGSDDPVKGKADDEALIDAIVTSPRVMRQMPQLLREAGLELIASFSYLLAEIGKADFWAPAIGSFQRLLAKAGVMARAQAQAWVDALVRASEQGLFFGASNYYGYVVRKPGA